MITLFANCSSGSDITFSKLQGSPILYNDILYYKDTGTVTIKASALGNNYFNPAPDVIRTFKIVRAKQILSFDTITNHIIGDSAVILKATSNFGLPIQFVLIAGPAKLDSNKLIFTGTGTVTVRATQNGDEHYLPATVDRTFIVTDALPVTLINFDGSLNSKNEVNLNWETAQEINTSYFVIERSPNENIFSSIGQVNASGNSSSTRYYSYTDKQPANGTNFYRLKMIDTDEKYAYSNIVAIKMDSKNKFQIFPNPANDILYVQASSINEIATLQIIDVTGRKLKEEKIHLNGNSSFSINIKDLPKGVYTLLLKSKTKQEHQKFVKE